MTTNEQATMTMPRLAVPRFGPARPDTELGAEIPDLTRELPLEAGVTYDLWIRYNLFVVVDSGQVVAVAPFMDLAGMPERMIGVWREQSGHPIVGFHDPGELPAFRMRTLGGVARLGVLLRTSFGSPLGLSAQSLGTNIERISEAI